MSVTNSRAEKQSETSGTEHLELLGEGDLALIERTFNENVVDPGVRSLQEIQQMSTDEFIMYEEDRARWHETMPMLETRTSADILSLLKTFGTAAGGHRDHQQRVPIVYGDPGVGKSMMSREIAAYELERLARLDLLRSRGNAAPQDPRQPRSQKRRVIHFELKGAMSRVDFERSICEELGQVKRGDWSTSLTHGLQTCGTVLLVLDEIQFINFGGGTGRQVHNAVKNITNAGTRVIIFGNDINWVIGPQTSQEGHLARRQSAGRWIPIEFRRLEHKTVADVAEWQDLLAAYENRLRLADAGQPGWLWNDLEEYVYAATNGYLNAVATLLLVAASLVGGKSERITREVLDLVPLEQAAQDGRASRIELLDARKRRP